jgi:hypothetical protein
LPASAFLTAFLAALRIVKTFLRKKIVAHARHVWDAIRTAAEIGGDRI